MDLLVLIILATVFYTLFDVFASKASGHLEASLSVVIINLLGASLPFILYLILRADKRTKLIPTTRAGVMYSALAGISIAVFTVLFIKIFQKGELSYVVPAIYGGTVVLAALIGYFAFHDHISMLQLTGIVLATTGVGLIVISKL